MTKGEFGMEILEIVQTLERFDRGYVAAVTDEEYAAAVAAGRDLIIQQGERITELEFQLEHIRKLIQGMIPTFAVNVELLRCICAELSDVPQQAGDADLLTREAK